jgi:hypothetical protein
MPIGTISAGTDVDYDEARKLFPEPIEQFATVLADVLIDSRGGRTKLTAPEDAEFIKAGLAPFCPEISPVRLEGLMWRLRAYCFWRRTNENGMQDGTLH